MTAVPMRHDPQAATTMDRGATAAIVSPEERLTLAQIDRSCALPVLIFIISGVCWLLIGTLMALIVSAKMHSPGMLSGWEWLTFGRMRPAHLNAVAALIRYDKERRQS